ncbi:Synaptic vesicle glycoprotein 2C [Lamellibrachia satsuma]|nr:Synaptic vesicle glycoprotein 2C [Lamellibrachia satsuma]
MEDGEQQETVAETGFIDKSPLLRNTETAPLTATEYTQGRDVLLGYEAAVAVTGYGWFHYQLLALCGWAVSSDAIEILSISFILPPATCDLHLSDSDKGWLNSSLFIGMMVGGYLWGTLADVVGRRTVLLWSLTMNALGGLASSFAHVYWLFLLLRVISGIGVGGSMPVIFTYFTEFQPKDRRGGMISMLATFWMAGNIVAAGLAWLVIPHSNLGVFEPNFVYNSWRIYLALCTLPSLTSALMFVLMPESPKFLMQKGEEQRAMEVFQRMYRGNKPRHSSFHVNRLEVAINSKVLDHKASCCGRIKSFANMILQSTVQLFQVQLRKLTLVMISVFFTLSFGYYGLWMWFPELFKRTALSGGSVCEAPINSNHSEPQSDCNSESLSSEIYYESFITAAANLPGNIFTIVLIDRIGRKSLLVASMLVSGGSVFFVWFLKTKTQSLIMSCVFSGVSVIGWNVLDVLGVELFPTHLRSTAAGVFNAAGRIGAILGNMVFGQLVTAHCAVPMLMVAVLLSAGGLTALWLPNSTRRDLP